MILMITESEYRDLAENHGSWCPDCGNVENHTDVEPDRTGAPCDNCLNSNVMGIEQALICGKVEFTEVITEEIKPLDMSTTARIHALAESAYMLQEIARSTANEDRRAWINDWIQNNKPLLDQNMTDSRCLLQGYEVEL